MTLPAFGPGWRGHAVAHAQTEEDLSPSHPCPWPPLGAARCRTTGAETRPFRRDFPPKFFQSLWVPTVTPVTVKTTRGPKERKPGGQNDRPPMAVPAVRGTRAPLLISPWGHVRCPIKHACHPKGVPGFPSSQIHTVWLPTTYPQRVSSDGCCAPKIRKLWPPKTKDTARANPKSDPRKRKAVCQRVIPAKRIGVPLLQPKLQVGSTPF